MTDSVLIELVKQGGFALLCGVMFWVYRQDSKGWAIKQSQTAEAFMSFGERTAASLTKVADGLQRQSVILDRIEQNLNANHLCPVTQVSTEMLREGMESPEGGRRRIDVILRAALKEATKSAHLDGPVVTEK